MATGVVRREGGLSDPEVVSVLQQWVLYSAVHNEWFCVRCWRCGCSGGGSRAWSLRRQRLVSPNSRAKEEGKEKGAFREARYPGRAGEGAPSNVPLTVRVQVQLMSLLTSLRCSEALLGEVQKAVKAKAKPRVVPTAEHAVFVLQDTWDRAEAHLKTLRESAERKVQECQAAVQRATDHALIAEKHKKEKWKARRELDKNKNAGSCPSTSEAEHMSVASSDDGLAEGLDDEEMRQNYLEDVFDAAPSQPPPKKVKASSSSGRPNKDTSQVASSALVAVDVSKCQNEEQATLTVQSCKGKGLAGLTEDASEKIERSVVLC